jgi:monothiol glutaredoxin
MNAAAEQRRSKKQVEDYSLEECEEVLENIKDNDKIIAYDREDERYIEMCNKTSDDFLLVNLSISDNLRRMFMDKYRVRELPVSIVGKINIYYSPAFADTYKAACCAEKEASIEIAKALIKNNRLMIFVKGTPDHPQCGFTDKLVKILEGEGLKWGTDYMSYNVLSNNHVREELKRYSNWPTYPQVYVEGTFIGGLDILRKCKERGELRSVLKI